MKFVTVTLGLFAALTTAYSHPRHPHFVYKRQNITSSVTAQSAAASDAAGLTTLTVLTTSVHTVISCAATITDCPANSADLSTLPASALSTVIVTQTIELATTVCPVTEASSIQTSILSAHESGSLPGVTRTAADTATITSAPAVISSAEAEATSSGSESSPDVTEVVVSQSIETVTSENAITMTLGGGNGGRVVTTTITKKVKSTHYVTQTVVHTNSAPAAQETSGNSAVGDNSGSDSGSGSGSQDTTIEGTTTTTAYTTGTRTVTVKKGSTETATAKAGSGSGSGSSGSGNSDVDTGACSCPAADQVTVTLPAQTLYVTMTVTAGSSAETPANNNNAAQPDTTTTEQAAATTTDASDAEETECPPEVIVTATVLPQFTLSNSSTTATATGTGAAAPTNGLKFRRSNMLYH